MPFRNFARISGAPSALALALALVQPAIAAEAPGMPSIPPVATDLPLHTPGSPPPAGAPDMRPVWHDSGLLQPGSIPVRARPGCGNAGGVPQITTMMGEIGRSAVNMAQTTTATFARPTITAKPISTITTVPMLSPATA